VPRFARARRGAPIARLRPRRAAVRLRAAVLRRRAPVRFILTFETFPFLSMK
jgi:hypothetical protein